MIRCILNPPAPKPITPVSDPFLPCQSHQPGCSPSGRQKVEESVGEVRASGHRRDCPHGARPPMGPRPPLLYPRGQAAQPHAAGKLPPRINTPQWWGGEPICTHSKHVNKLNFKMFKTIEIHIQTFSSCFITRIQSVSGFGQSEKLKIPFIPTFINIYIY